MNTDGYDLVDLEDDPPVGEVRLNVVSMNMAGRFTGREIKKFGQEVIRHVLLEKDVGVFFGQQINFKPSLPINYEHIGAAKAFIFYDRERFRACDAKQYKHFLRDLHLSGQLPHHYLPENNYVTLKMRYKEKPWSEFIAMSWAADDKQPRLKSVSQFKKVMAYAYHLSIVEEMPVLIGGTFRFPLHEAKTEMEADFHCYGYRSGTPRRMMRMSDFFICSKPLKLEGVRPLVCANLDLGEETRMSPGKWFNPEDAFYWDPVISSLVMPIRTPNGMPQDAAAAVTSTATSTATPKTNIPFAGVNHSFRHSAPNTPTSPATPTYPATNHSFRDASSKSGGKPAAFLSHRSTAAPRQSNINLPTAPVPPTKHGGEADRGAGDSGAGAGAGAGATSSTPAGGKLHSPSPEHHSSAPQLPAIAEVPTECERATDFSSGSLRKKTTEGSAPMLVGLDQTDQEEKIFQLLETMMNDKTSTFYCNSKGEIAGSGTEMDLAIFKQASKRLSQSAGQIDPSSQSPAALNNKPHRTPSYLEIYDEELIQENNQCYMS